MLFSLLEHYLNLYITDTTLKVFQSFHCFTTSNYLMVLRGVWASLMLFLKDSGGPEKDLFISSGSYIMTFNSSGPEKDRLLASAVGLLLLLLLLLGA